MANTQRPPAPVLHQPTEGADLGSLADALDSGALPPERVGPVPARTIVRGDEDDLLDLSALVRSGTSAQPIASARASGAPRLSETLPAPPLLDEDPIVLPRRSRPAWLTPLLIGLGVGAALSGVLFATSSGGAPQAAPHAQAMPATAPAAPAALLASPPPAVVNATPAVGSLGVRAAQAKVQAPGALRALPAARVPVAAVGAASNAKTTQDAAPSAVAARGVTRSTPSTASVHPYDGPPAPSATPIAPTSSAPAAPPVAPSGPVLVVRPASEPEPTPVAAVPQPIAAPAAAASARRTGGSLDALLDDALSPEARHAELARAPQPPSPAVLPRMPSREDVARMMGGLQTAIRGCAMGQTGVATAALSIRNDGRVASAQVSGAPFAGTPSGRCMEGVLRSAQFQRFKEPSFSVRYPFPIQ